MATKKVIEPNLFLSLPETFTLRVLYMRDPDAAFFNNEPPKVIETRTVECNHYELQDLVKAEAAKVNADTSLPREHSGSKYLVRATNSWDNLVACA
jgi:hypothetical protein